MSGYVIHTDSACDIDPSILREWGVGCTNLTFRFNGDNVVMRPSSNPPVSIMAESLKETVKSVIKQPLVQTAVSKALPKIVPLIDAVQRGKIKD